MWKVIVVICALGNPCTVFQEEPAKYYDTKQECLSVAAEKEQALIGAFDDFGYTVEKNGHNCERKKNINSV